MAQRNRSLEVYITDILNGKDEKMTYLSQEYSSRFLAMIKTLDLNPSIFSSCLKTISDELFSKDGNNDPYINSFLLFSIELNHYCVLNYSWYSTDILVHELIEILSKECQKLTYKSKCNILYHRAILFIPLTELD